MKNFVYMTLGAVLVFISLAILLVYYTQDFTEDFDFYPSIESGDVAIKNISRKDYTLNKAIEYLDEARANLGVLNLENNGVFNQKYQLPRLLGCLDLSDNVDKNSLLYKNNKVNIYIDPSVDSPGTYYHRQASDSINIKIGEQKTLDIIGIYRYSLPMSQFSLDNIESISIYKIPKKENNPLSEGGYYNDYAYTDTCEEVKSELDPIATIKIISGE